VTQQIEVFLFVISFQGTKASKAVVDSIICNYKSPMFIKIVGVKCL